MKLLNASQNNMVIVEKLTTADGFFARLRGLLGRSHLAGNEGLYIPACNSIHTFFMQFAIDAIFVDNENQVCAIYENLKPWRLTKMVWKARAVYELAAGTLAKTKIHLGDQLHVAP